MKLQLVTLLCVLAVCYAQVKLPQTTEDEIKEILSTKEGAKEFVDCVKFPKRCRDERASQVARIAPMLLRTQGRCKNVKGIECTAQDEKNIRLVISTLSSKYNGLYNSLLRSLLRNA